MTILYILLAILLLGILIMVHEMGHFFAARMCGIAVKEFSIGFGPKLLQWQSKKHETLFSIRPVPLGGYCMFYGDTDDDPDGTVMKDDPRNYNKAAVWKRMISVIAGPLMNIVLAFVVAVAFAFFYGTALTTPYVAEVTPGAPAAIGGLVAGDTFMSINGVDMLDLTSADVSDAITKTNGEAVSITVDRDGEAKELTLTPKLDAESGRYLIGITITQVTDLPKGQVLPAAWNITVETGTAIVSALGKLFTTGEGLDQTSGPIGVVQLVAEQTRQGGLEMFLYLMIFISINLGLMNLLPIPGLDGSRLIFMIFEAFRGKPVNQRIESRIILGGYLFLFGFMIFFTFKDVVRIFS
ncbi:MAG: site-2 protease family protein [Clostridiales bacterium]|nr:site-2 protease family protein [Clostridiales bacterium]